jgi:hypothetical protein
MVDNDTHDYEIVLDDPTQGAIHTVKKNLTSFNRSLENPFSIGWVEDEHSNRIGISVSKSNLPYERVQSFIDTTVAKKVGYTITELVTDPAALRTELNQARNKISKLEKQVVRAERRKDSAESELAEWIEVMEVDEASSGLMELVLGSVARISGTQSYDQNLLRNQDDLRKYLQTHLDQIPSGFLQASTSLTNEDEDVVVFDPLRKISTMEAVKILFKLTTKQTKSRDLMDYCSNRLNQELSWRTFSQYDNLLATKTDRGMAYDKDRVLKFAIGEDERISSSSGLEKSVHRYQVVHLKEPELAAFFRDGVYNENDTMVKYGLSKAQLAGFSLDRADRDTIALLEKLELDTRSGEGIFYKKEELDLITRK